MTLKPLTLAAVVGFTLLGMSACDKAMDEQKKANDAQAKANAQIAEVARDAELKMKASQAEADKKIAEAQASFMKLREDYRHTITTSVAALDLKLAELQARADTAKGSDKADLQLKAAHLKASRDAFMVDFQSLESASALTWDETRARLDKQWAELKALAG